MALTLYWAVQPIATANWANNSTGGAQIKNGQDGAGSALSAGSYGSQAYSATGTLDMSTAASGLAAGTAYEIGFVVYDSTALTYSNVVVSGTITTINAYALDVTPGAYTLTGQSVDLSASRILDVTPGSYTLTGSAVGLVTAYLLDIAPTTYSITGFAVTLTYASAGNYTLDVTPGTYALTGSTIELATTRVLDVSPGSYAISGAAATLLVGYALNTTPGSYAISGVDVTLSITRLLDVAPGSYAISGPAVTLTYGIGGTYSVNVTPGSYTITGSDVELVRVAIYDSLPELSDVTYKPGTLSVTGFTIRVTATVVGAEVPYALGPSLFAASANGWLAMTRHYEDSGTPGIVNDLSVMRFWLATGPDATYTVIRSVSTLTTDPVQSPQLHTVLGRIAQTSNYVLSIEPTTPARFVRAPLDLAANPDVVSPNLTFTAPRILAAEATRFLLFGDSNTVFSSTDGETWTSLGAMAGATPPHDIGSPDYLTHCITKIGSRWFLSFGLEGGLGATTNRLFYTDHADARTGWTACSGITPAGGSALHEEVVYDGTSHYAATTNFYTGVTTIYASSDGGATFAAETTCMPITGFETSSSGTTAAFMFQFQVTGTTGSDYVRAYMINGVVFEKLVGTTSWSAKASLLINPYYGVVYGGAMSVADNPSWGLSVAGATVKHETAGVFALSDGF